MFFSTKYFFRSWFGVIVFIIFFSCKNTKRDKLSHSTAYNYMMNEIKNADTSEHTEYRRLMDLLVEKQDSLTEVEADSMFLQYGRLAVLNSIQTGRLLYRDSITMKALQPDMQKTLEKLNYISDTFFLFFKMDTTKYLHLIQNLSTNISRRYTDSLWHKGMILTYNEGLYLPMARLEDAIYRMGRRCSPAMKEFNEIAYTFSQQLLMYNNGLLVSPKILTHRIRTWEDYIMRYPDHERSKAALSLCHQYAQLLLFGMRATPAWSDGSGRLDSEFYDAWQFILLAPNESKLYKMMSRIDRYCRDHSYTITEHELDSIHSILLEYYPLPQ